MKHSPPPPGVLQAFGLTSMDSVLLAGGQGATYQTESVILKPVFDTEEAEWCADILAKLPENGFRLTRPILSQQEKWIVDGWCAFRKVVGEHKKGMFQEKIEVCNKFHNILQHVPRPDFFDRRNDPWAVADRYAWGEVTLTLHPSIEAPVSELRKKLASVDLPSQVIHGDIGGNFLFANDLPPAVIDFTPYWRPASFALAVLIVDMLAWEDAEPSIINTVDMPDMKQLLLRAEIRRLVEIDQRFQQFGPGYLEKTTKHLPVVKMLCALEQ